MYRRYIKRLLDFVLSLCALIVLSPLLLILMILGAITAVNVIAHQRPLAQVERDGIAKEIFVAAQVHLTMAESQGNGTCTDGGELWQQG